MGKAESFLKRNMQAAGSPSRPPSSIPPAERQSVPAHAKKEEASTRRLPAWARTNSVATRPMTPTPPVLPQHPSSPNAKQECRTTFAVKPSLKKKPAFGGAIAVCLIGVGILAWLATLGESADERESNGYSSQAVALTVDRDLLHRKVSKSVFAIFTGEGAGSGFALTDRDLITNRHVVDSVGRHGKVIVRSPQIGHALLGSVRKIAKRHDLAWIALEEPLPCDPLKLSPVPCKVGDFVFTEGFPGYGYQIGTEFSKWDFDNLEPVFSSGEIKVANRLWGEQKTRCYEISATVNNGNSGGPLLNARGEVVGVNTYGLSELKVENCFFAIKADVIHEEFPLLWDKAHGADTRDIYEFAD